MPMQEGNGKGNTATCGFLAWEKANAPLLPHCPAWAVVGFSAEGTAVMVTGSQGSSSYVRIADVQVNGDIAALV